MLGSLSLLASPSVFRSFSPSSSKNRSLVSYGISCNDSGYFNDDNLEEDREQHIGILDVDTALVPFKDHFQYRINKYVDQKTLFVQHEGGLEEFAQGYLKFGFNKEDDGIVYCAWAPAAQEAQVVRNFNGWDGSNHKMEKNQFGV